MVIVYPTVPPATTNGRFAVLVMVSAGTRMVKETVQRGSVLPWGQLLPGVAVLSVVVTTALPESGVSAVRVPVMVTVAPTGMSPVQSTPVSPIVRMPEEAVWSPLGTVALDGSATS